MTMQETVAANVRARLAWSRISHETAAEAAGCSVRSFRYKLSGEYGFRPDELAGLAKLLKIGDPGLFFRVPEGFGVPTSVPVWIPEWAGQNDFALAA